MKWRSLFAVVVLVMMPAAMLMATPHCTLVKPPPGRYGIEELWKAVVISDTACDAWFEGFVFEETHGQVFHATTKPFPLTRGTKVYGYRDVRIDQTQTAEGYEGFVTRVGLPQGRYRFKLLLMSFGVGDSFTFDVKPMGQPRLISPGDRASVTTPYPSLVWGRPANAVGLVTYDLKIVGVLSGQTALEAVAANLPWFEQKRGVSTSLKYPVSARSLEPGTQYAWQVTATTADGQSATSEIWTFVRAPSAAPPSAPGDSVRVIVRLTRPASDSMMRYIRTAIGAFEPKFVYHIIPGFAATLSVQQIALLKKDSAVERVTPVFKVHAHMDKAQTWFGTTKARADFGVDGNRFGTAATYSKQDVVIGFLDTGVDPGHADLDGGKVIGWMDYVGTTTTANDDPNWGHGTHCASIAAGSGDGNSIYKGVAPGAAIVGVKVLDESGVGFADNVLAGVQWVVDNKATYGIDILAICLGTSDESSDGTDVLSVACNAAVDAGLVVCVSAGNASSPDMKKIGIPAAAAKVITVGAMADCGEGGFYPAGFPLVSADPFPWSARGPTLDGRIKPDICGPGVNIVAAKAGGTHTSYTAMSGTSAACAFVAGVCALMLDANPSLTPAQVKSKLMAISQGWGPPGKDNDYGAGRLQAWTAVRISGGVSGGSAPTVPSHISKVGNLAAMGSYDDWKIKVTSNSYPVAATLIMTSGTGSSPDFNLELIGPSPSTNVVKSTSTTTRQDWFTCSPAPGEYTLKITSASGAGPYSCDVSGAVVDLTPVLPYKERSAPLPATQIK